MPAVQADGGLVVGIGLLQVLVGKVLVPRQGKGVREGWRQVDRSLEEAQRRGVLLRACTFSMHVKAVDLPWQPFRKALHRARGAVDAV